MHTEQKVWSNWSLGQQNYLIYPTFTKYFVITWLFSSHDLLWGPFLWGPVRPNMLNMPKSASEAIRTLCCPVTQRLGKQLSRKIFCLVGICKELEQALLMCHGGPY